jgi:hypothetical protein
VLLGEPEQVDIGPDTSTALSAGDRLDYAMAIDGLLEEGPSAAARASAEASPDGHSPECEP